MRNRDRFSGHTAFSPVTRKFHTGDVVILVICGLFFIVGLTMLGGSLALIADPWRKGNWIGTPGEMIKSDTVRKGRNGTRADVLYRYEVSGQSYYSDRTNFGITLGSTERRYVQSHPAGSALTVLVNPADPTEAVLTREPSGGWLLLPVAGMFLLIPSGILRSWLRTRRRNGIRQTRKQVFGSPYHRSRSRRRRA